MAPIRTQKTNNRTSHTPSPQKTVAESDHIHKTHDEDEHLESSSFYSEASSSFSGDGIRPCRGVQRVPTEISWPICKGCGRFFANEQKFKTHMRMNLRESTGAVPQAPESSQRCNENTKAQSQTISPPHLTTQAQDQTTSSSTTQPSQNPVPSKDQDVPTVSEVEPDTTTTRPSTPEPEDDVYTKSDWEVLGPRLYGGPRDASQESGERSNLFNRRAFVFRHRSLDYLDDEVLSPIESPATPTTE
ncbi:hypothetical protein BDN72DRAFT_843561 [Pluteus cervinus]|uniref:Uncharacterized protein n=1 Tax=Pluteus cervinus TaxID=181527 RepID=A0ACD3AN98_9AGAR|nr:hypothetical protein BDN72DRAFT_843561 [Pluteus cervinus]